MPGRSSGGRRRSGGRTAAWALAGVLAVAGGLTAGTAPAAADTAPPTAGTPVTVSADALPTVQVDGVVWSQVVVGNTVYAGGKFTTARPAGAAPGTNTVTRTNLLAYDIRTGALVTTFAPTLNGQVQTVAASPDGTRLYVGGEFTSVNGVNRYRVAAFNTATGALVSTWAPTLDYRARAIVATNTTVYVGGAFNVANGNTRNRLAAFSASTGALLAWAPAADAGVLSMVMAPDGSKLVVGGQFTKLAGVAAYGMGALDPVTGAVLPWNATKVLRNAGTNAAINSLSTDGTNIYGTGYVFGAGGNIEGGFALTPSTGDIVWVQDCHGDHYGGYVLGGVFYTVGHAHYCGNVGGFPQTNPWTFHRALAFTAAATGTVKRNAEGNYYNFQGQPAPSPLTWYPELTAGTFTGQTQAAWSVTGNGQYVVLGGEFPRVNGVGQQGLVRFAVKSAAPNTQGPVVRGAAFVPALTSPASGTVRATWTANWDRDNEALTYSLVRDGRTDAPVYRVTARSQFWQRPRLGFTDTGLTPGQTYRYRLVVTDPLGNTVAGDSVSVTAASNGVLSPYAAQVLQDGAAPYWRLGEASGSTATDWAGVADGTVGTGVTRGAAGAVTGDPDTAVTLNGTSSGTVVTPAAETGPQAFSVEAWIRTTSTSGGKVVGFGNAATGASSSYDRHLYVDSGGRVTFGVYPGSVQTVRSAGAVNDGAWHHLVGTLDGSGARLYVDGVLAGTNTAATSAQGYSGYWRVGGDNLNGWPNAPASSSFAGSVDEVAVYSRALTAAEVGDHHVRATQPGAANAKPAAAFSATASGLTAAFDATASSDTDGTIASYAWDFGDGSTGTGATPSHAYAAAGTYTVALTVTDDRGATGTASKAVTVTAPPANVAPVAAFTAAAAGLTATFDASGSSDADGTIASYAWDFGDGTTGTGAKPGHTYATAGTYTVRLTVTDDDGATGTVSKAVPVTAAGTLASDAFSRTVASGWGTADSGGAWTASGASSLSVAGGTGRIRMGTAGSGPSAFLNGVSSTASDTTVSVALDAAATGGGVYVSVVGRRVGTSDHRLKIRVASTGAVTASLVANAAGTETTLRSVTVPGVTYVAGDVLLARLQVTGTSPTTLSARVWKQGAAEPASWQLTATDSTAALQAAGGVGLVAYLSGSGTAPVTASFDDLVVRPAG